MKIYTIGYEGLDLERYTVMLLKYGIQTLIDVREAPVSRIHGFSKNQLAQKLREMGIVYQNPKALGCPREIRYKYKQDKDWIKYANDFLDYLAQQHEILTWLADIVVSSKCCLMCFEQNANQCHRSFVASYLKEICIPNLEIVDIRVLETMGTDTLTLEDKQSQQLTTDLEIGALFP